MMRWTLKPKSEPTKVKALEKALQVDDNCCFFISATRRIETYDDAKHFFRPSLDRFTRSFFNERYGTGCGSH